MAFVEAGARATDHGHLLADTTPIEVSAVRGCSTLLGGTEATEDEVAAFAANMLFQMAEMSCDDGLVMQIHPGVLRDHTPPSGDRTGRTRVTTFPFRPSSPGPCDRC